MKTLILLTAALALTGCASTDYAQYTKAQTDIAAARHNADAARYQALASIAKDGTDSARVAAVMALALSAGSQQQAAQIAAPQPNQAIQWASILVPGLTQVAGMRYNFLSQQTASNNAAALGLSTNAAFVGLAGRIQAPGSVTTITTTDRNDTTNTLSGTGTLGGGAYSFTDRHDVTSPIAQIVPTVIQPTVITPTVIQPVFAPGTPTTP